MLRRVFALMSVISVVIAAAACSTTVVEEATTSVVESEIQTTAAPIEEITTAVPEITTEIQTTEAITQEATTEAPAIEASTEPATEASTEPATEAPTTAAPVDDPSTWDTARIIEFYKASAESTGNSARSEQTVGLQDISVNNGQLGGVFSFVTPILNSFLSSSTSVTDGITGEFEKLCTADVSSARAYTTGKETVIEITLNEQIDKGSGGAGDGSVSHGIYVVGDLMSVMSQLKDKGLPIDISLENTVITYSAPVIKAVVDENGKIINGTWSCTVEISLSDYKFAGSTVDSTRVVLNNKITVNGGFNP